MSSVASLSQPALPPCQLYLTGKIVSSRRHENKIFTKLITPAKDEYSKPNVFEVVSNQTLGVKDSVFSGVFEMTGFVFEKPYVDKNQQPQVFYDRTVNLTLVDA